MNKKALWAFRLEVPQIPNPIKNQNKGWTVKRDHQRNVKHVVHPNKTLKDIPKRCLDGRVIKPY